MSSIEIANAYVALTVKAPGVKKDIEDTITGAAPSAGAKFSSLLAGAVGGAVAAVTSKVIDTVMGSIDSAISRVDTLTNFPKIMANLGYSSDDATASITEMSDRLTGLPTALDTMTNAVQKIAPLTDSLGEATDISLALNDALLAGGQSTALQSTAMEQYTQMLSVGKVDMVAWNSLVSAMPGQMDQLAKSLLGTTANSQTLYSAMSDGTVTFDQFNAALLDLDQNGTSGFASFQTQAADATDGIATGVANMNTAVTRGLASLIAKFQPQITGIIGGITDVVNQAFIILGAVADWVNQNADWLTPLAVGLGIAAAALAVITIATWAWNAALAVNPITWIILGIGLLIGAIILLVMNWDAVVAWITQVWGGFIGWITDVINGFVGWWNGIWTAVWEFLVNAWNVMVEVVRVLWETSFIGWLVNTLTFLIANWDAVWALVGQVFTDIWNNIVAFGASIIQGFIDWILNAWNAFVAANAAIWNGVVAFFAGIWDGIIAAVQSVQTAFSNVFGAIAGIVTGAFDGVVSVVRGIMNGIIDIINGAIDGINGVVGAVGGAFGIDISIGKLPHLAEGATIQPRHGGTLAVLAEAGRAESVVDTGLLNQALEDGIAGSRGGVQVDVHPAPGMDEVTLGQTIGNQVAFALGGR